MGWNTSLIIIENKEHYSNEKELLERLGFQNLEQKESTTFDAILNPKKNQIGIGYYNENLIICDGYLLTTKALEESKNLNLATYEKSLVQLFPKSEIVTVSCVSSVNFHGYSLIQNSVKQRLKWVSAEMKQEFGNRFEEEIEIYKNSYEQDGALLWKDEQHEDAIYTEDQLMEDFTFKVAKRRLGIQIDTEEGEELSENTEFKVFQINNISKTGTQEIEKSKTNKFKWKKQLLVVVIIVVIRILFKILFK